MDPAQGTADLGPRLDTRPRAPGTDPAQETTTVSILLTGAAGFIGSHLTERLLERGEAVVGVDNFDAFYDPGVKERNLERARRHPSFALVRGDLRDAGLYPGLPDDIDTVIHLAARAGVRPSIEDPHLYMDVNLQGTLLLLEFMRTRGVHRLLFGSSSSVYGDDAPTPFSEEHAGDHPISPYAATKRAGELLVHTYHHLYDIDAICLRFFTVYGPRQRPDLAIHKFARLMAAGDEVPMFGDGSSERDYTYIDDILDGVERALGYLREHAGTYELVNLGSARTIRLDRMIAMVAEALGTEPRVSRLPARAGDVRRTYADVGKAERLLGYAPGVPFAEGLRRFATWFHETHAAAAAAGD
jgi:UDP-glucuronate 4-epimerase